MSSQCPVFEQLRSAIIIAKHQCNWVCHLHLQSNEQTICRIWGNVPPKILESYTFETLSSFYKYNIDSLLVSVQITFHHSYMYFEMSVNRIKYGTCTSKCFSISMISSWLIFHQVSRSQVMNLQWFMIIKFRSLIWWCEEFSLLKWNWWLMSRKKKIVWNCPQFHTYEKYINIKRPLYMSSHV